MYIRSIEIDNVGPIGYLSVDLPFKDEIEPLPLIVVGENGSGKSILISHLVNALITAKHACFDDVEIEQGKVYKYREPKYIKSGCNYYYSKVTFDDNQCVEEWQIDRNKSKYEEDFGQTPVKSSWAKIKDDESSLFLSTFNNNAGEANKLFEQKCCLYFPVNRYEEPAWLNIDNLKDRPSFFDKKRISRQSNREIVLTAPLKNNQSYILDIILDRNSFELATEAINVSGLNSETKILTIFHGFNGQSSRIYEAILKLARTILKTPGNIRFGIGDRRNRQISIMKDEIPWIPNIFQLSTGEVLLLNFFISIIRDFDLSDGNMEDLSDVSGIVIIDEADAHLHTSHQNEVLPNLIAFFPKVQFVITTHSPLFVLGLQQKLGNDGFKVVNMPDGKLIAASDFTEYMNAYEAFKATTLHRNEIEMQLKNATKPIVFVEGDYDIRYIIKAAELLNKSDLLERVHIKDGTGFGNLDKIWKNFDCVLAQTFPISILLLYDCDTNKKDADRGNITKRTIPVNIENPINVGIENLFKKGIIDKAESANVAYIDVTESTKSRIRGNDISTTLQKSVNKDEKGNLCKWICLNGTHNDFENFSTIFEIIEKFLQIKI